MPNALLKRLSSAPLFVALAVAMPIVSVMLDGGGAIATTSRATSTQSIAPEQQVLELIPTVKRAEPLLFPEAGRLGLTRQWPDEYPPKPQIQLSNKQSTEEFQIPFEQTGTLADGDDAADDGRLFDVYGFVGEEGQIIKVLLTSEVFDTQLLLLDPEKELLVYSNDSYGNSNSELVFQLPQTGEYSLLVTSDDGGVQGEYALKAGVGTEAEWQTTQKKAEADRLYYEAIELWQISQWQEALEGYENALVLYQEIGVREAFPLESRQGEANTLAGFGKVTENLGQYAQALNYYQQSLEIKREVGDRVGEGATLSNIGIIHASLSDYSQALNYFDQALRISREVGDLATEGTTLNSIGFIYDQLGNYPQALDYFEQSLEIQRETSDSFILIGNGL